MPGSSLPCGWILGDTRGTRIQGKRVGEMLFRAISARLKKDGVETVGPWSPAKII